MKKHRFLKPALILVSPLFFYFTAVLIGGIVKTGETETEKSDYFILLLDNGYHIALGLPSDLCPYPQVFRDLDVKPGENVFYYFGWGDRDFYVGTPTVRDLDYALALKALFIPTDSVLEVSRIAMNSFGNEGITQIPVSAGKISKIYDFIGEELEFPGEGLKKLSEIKIDPAFKGSLFFLTPRRYHLFFTCNNWTGKALKSAGIKTGIWTPLSWGLGARQ